MNTSTTVPSGDSQRQPVAIVTGGSAGIGAAICHALAESGHAVISLSRRSTESMPFVTKSVEVDLMDPLATRQAAAELARTYPASIIVHNAGAVREKVLEEATMEDLTALFHLHMGAALTLVQANLAHMKAQRYGRVIMVSTRAILGLAKRTAYSATKAGMIGMTRTWALELAPFGITVNAVAPGPIAQTEMFDEVIPPDSPRVQALAQSIPVRRLGSPADVARAVQFFAEPANGFITGQTLFVCGGTSVGSVTI